MQTVEHPPAGPGATPPENPAGKVSASVASTEDDDLRLLLDWTRNPDETDRLRKAAIGTGVIHLLLILVLATISGPTPTPSKYVQRERRVTPLVDPPVELTQKSPNKGKISKELSVESIMPSIPVPTPAPGTKGRKFAPPPTPEPPKQPVAAPSVIEPPKIEQAQNTTPQIPLAQLPPQIQPQERPGEAKPKLAFEAPTAPNVGPNGGTKIPMPGNTVQEAVRDLSRNGNKGVSGSESMDLGTGAGLNLPPSAGRPRMDYELKSDPLGVDFRPYVLQVLAAVRRNWFAVYPESAKLGQRGQVKLDFAIAKDGKVTKVVYSWQSGSNALDHAAIAAISASNPLPPLPVEFRGDRIVLSFTFSYNMGR
jgi:TonB family protein